jgi:hypothetical protein
MIAGAAAPTTVRLARTTVPARVRSEARLQI